MYYCAAAFSGNGMEWRRDTHTERSFFFSPPFSKMKFAYLRPFPPRTGQPANQPSLAAFFQDGGYFSILLIRLLPPPLLFPNMKRRGAEEEEEEEGVKSFPSSSSFQIGRRRRRRKKKREERRDGSLAFAPPLAAGTTFF